MPSCCVFQCKNKGTHRLPTEKKRRKLWIEALQQRKIYPSASSRLCSDHFKPDDFYDESYYTGIKHQRKNLKKDAVPSLFSFSKEAPKSNKQLNYNALCTLSSGTYEAPAISSNTNEGSVKHASPTETNHPKSVQSWFNAASAHIKPKDVGLYRNQMVQNLHSSENNKDRNNRSCYTIPTANVSDNTATKHKYHILGVNDSYVKIDNSSEDLKNSSRNEIVSFEEEIVSLVKKVESSREAAIANGYCNSDVLEIEFDEHYDMPDEIDLVTALPYNEDKGAFTLHKANFLKDKLKAVLFSTKLCAICLECNECSLNSFNDKMILITDLWTEDVQIKDMYTYVFNEQSDLSLGRHVCIKCTENLKQSYIFIKNSNLTKNLLETYIKDIEEKSANLDKHVEIKNECNNMKSIIILENRDVERYLNREDKLISRDPLLDYDHHNNLGECRKKKTKNMTWQETLPKGETFKCKDEDEAWPEYQKNECERAPDLNINLNLLHSAQAINKEEG